MGPLYGSLAGTSECDGLRSISPRGTRRRFATFLLLTFTEATDLQQVTATARPFAPSASAAATAIVEDPTAIRILAQLDPRWITLDKNFGKGSGDMGQRRLEVLSNRIHP